MDVGEVVTTSLPAQLPECDNVVEMVALASPSWSTSVQAAKVFDSEVVCQQERLHRRWEDGRRGRGRCSRQASLRGWSWRRSRSWRRGRCRSRCRSWCRGRRRSRGRGRRRCRRRGRRGLDEEVAGGVEHEVGLVAGIAHVGSRQRAGARQRDREAVALDLTGVEVVVEVVGAGVGLGPRKTAQDAVGLTTVTLPVTAVAPEATPPRPATMNVAGVFAESAPLMPLLNRCREAEPESSARTWRPFRRGVVAGHVEHEIGLVAGIAHIGSRQLAEAAQGDREAVALDLTGVEVERGGVGAGNGSGPR